MDTLEAILSRRTVHFYDPDREIPGGLVEEALRAALRAPNHKLTNPWRFTRVGPETRAEIVELAVELKLRKNAEMAESKKERVRQKVGDSPELVVVSQRLDDDPFRRREDYAACACAIQNFMLALWNEGVSSKWSTGGVTRADETYELLGIDREEEEIVGFIFAGYPKVTPDPPREPLDAVYRELP